ncbi:MAG: hypothetical protein ACOCVA_05685, partial [Prolixibacteraceae bacterium]
VVLWALPIVPLSKAFSLFMLWTLFIVVLSKAFSLFGFWCLRMFGRFTIYLQAESLTYHNLRSVYRTICCIFVLLLGQKKILMYE